LAGIENHMLKELALFLLLIAIAAIFWFASTVYDIPVLSQFFLTTLAIAFIYLAVWLVIDRVANRVITDARTRYTFRKAVSIISFLVLAAVIIRIWVADPQVLLISYGLLAAVRERRVLHDRLSRLILEGVEASDRIRIASATQTITGTHEVKIHNPQSL
jgi:hypothetical protein